MGPVAVSGAPTAVQSAGAPEASARNTTDQPAGSVGGVTPGAVDAASTAARLKSSATAPLLVTQTRNRVAMAAAPGVTALVRITVVVVGPRPSAATAVPAGGAARSLVTSTVLAATAASVSVTSSNTALLKTDVARFTIEYAALGALAGSVTRTTTRAPQTAGETVVSLTKGAGHGWPTPGIGPVSGAAAPPLLMSGLAPSCWKKPTVVPAGKPFDVTVMSKVSVPLPRFHT